MFRRAVAFIIDGIVFSCALGIFSELTGWADVDTGVRSTASGEYFFDFGVDFRFDSIGDMLLAAVVFVLCKSVQEALFQKTLGKRVTGLLVVSDSGGDRVSWNQALLRNLLLVPSGALLFLPSFIAMLLNEGKRISDSLFDTLVVRSDESVSATNDAVSVEPIEGQYAWQADGGGIALSKSTPWYQTKFVRVVFGTIVAGIVLWAALEYDIIRFGESTSASDPLQPGEIFRKSFDEEFEDQESEFGRYYWQDGTAVFETSVPFVMATRYFNVESDEEALSLSVSARRLVGGDGIATLQWSLDETSSRGFAVYVAWTGGDITCGVVQTEGASLPPVHLKMPTASCGQPLDGWYHLEIASNGSTLAFLVNGVEQVSEQSSDSMQSIGFGAEQSVMDDTAFAAQFDDLILRDAA